MLNTATPTTSSNRAIPLIAQTNSQPAITSQAFRQLSAIAARQARHFRLSPEQTEDIQQEALLRLVKAQQAGSPIDNPSAWIARVSRNLCLDLYDKKKVRREESFEEICHKGGETRMELTHKPTNNETISVKITINNSQQNVDIHPESLQAILPQLIAADKNEQRRTVSEMWFIKNLNAHDIAKNTGIPTGTIRSHVTRFRQSIRLAVSEMALQDNLC